MNMWLKKFSMTFPGLENNHVFHDRTYPAVHCSVVFKFSIRLYVTCLLFPKHSASRTERKPSEAPVRDWRLGASADAQPGETSRCTQQPRECDSSSSPLLSLKTYLRRSSSTSSSTDSMSSTQQIVGGQWRHTHFITPIWCRSHTAVEMINGKTKSRVESSGKLWWNEHFHPNK